MNKRLLIVLLALVLVAAGFGLRTHFREAHGGAHSHGDAHAHGDTGSVLELNQGKKWDTDLPLRTGMQRIRDAAAPALAARAKGTLSADQAKALSASIQQNVNYLIENCKLEPKADAVLHVFITDLLRGGALLAGDPSSQEGTALVSEALRRYPEYFDDSSWVPIPATRG